MFQIQCRARIKGDRFIYTMLNLLTYCYLFNIISLNFCASLPTKHVIDSYRNHTAVKKFQEYLRIDTSQEENIKHAVEFWRRQAAELDLPFAVYEPAGKPICVITWKGVDPSLPSIMLNSHMDVVDADKSAWTHPPFDGHMDENGDIYGRGAQDTKDIAIQYIEAIRKLKNDNVVLQRTLYVTLVPDEETGGYNGLKVFIETDEFKAMNVGFVLDEGLSSPDGSLFATYQDRRPWQIKFTVKGESGHGSSMPDESAMEKTQKLIDTIMKFREEQKMIMKSTPPTDFGAYTSTNINMVHGGLLPNVIPGHVTVVIDMRLSTSTNITKMESKVESWVAVAGNNTSIEFIRREDKSAETQLDDSPYWRAVKIALADKGIVIKPIVCPATSDMLYLRNKGIPAIGFAPKTYTVSRIHGENEYLNAEIFLGGIEIYATVMKSLGNLS